MTDFRAGTWYPIESAPTDGTEVDLFVFDEGRLTGCSFRQGRWKDRDGNHVEVTTVDGFTFVATH